ncbi:MAG: thiamine-phosphate kinase [Azoarcus sp.]|jgi:thiamine-monophosphate kinase|nr:thiamine-phosphate kinase [Azoarcus sp.]
MPSEFDLIRRYFTRPAAHADLGVGDDAALFRVAAGMQLAVTTDTLVAGVHFFPDAAPRDLGWKTLAVNLSDLAAMGATPRWATLAISLPSVDEDWLAAFADGLFECATRYGIDLVGGDSTRGPLAMTVTALGEVPAGTAITRAGGLGGDDLWISGQPGLAALGLAILTGAEKQWPNDHSPLRALHRPVPRVELGVALRGAARAMLDVSDGLAGDLGHLCECSGRGAVLEAAALPLVALREAGADEALARRCLLSGGDDYELLFAAPPAARDDIAALARQLDVPLARIGHLVAEPAPILLCEADGRTTEITPAGFDHFATNG